MNGKWHFNIDQPSEGLFRQLTDGISTRVFAGRHVTISVVTLEPNVRSKMHHHPEEQWGILLSGECTRILGEEEVEMKVGDFWQTPPDIPHGMKTGDKGAVVLDIFAPPREEYLQPGSGYGHGEGETVR